MYYNITEIIAFLFTFVFFCATLIMTYFYISDKSITDAFQNFRRRRVTFIMYFTILGVIGLVAIGVSSLVAYLAWNVGIEYFDKPPRNWEDVANRLLMKIGIATALGIFYYILFTAYKEIRSHTIASMKRYWKSERLLYVDYEQHIVGMSDSSTDDAADKYFREK